MRSTTSLSMCLIAGIMPRSFGFTFLAQPLCTGRQSALNSFASHDALESSLKIQHQHQDQPPSLNFPVDISRESRAGKGGKTRVSSDRERLDRQYSEDDKWLLAHDSEEEWEHMYQLLQVFVMKHGKIPTLHDHPSLSHWCSQQYQFQRQPDKLTQLVKVGLWNEVVKTRTWDEWFLDLLDHYVTTGQSAVPPTLSLLPLAQWVHHQRSAPHLASRQRQLLWSINFVESNEEAEFQYHHSRLVQIEKQKRNAKRKRPLTVRQWKKLQQQQQLNFLSTESVEQALFGPPSSVWQL